MSEEKQTKKRTILASEIPERVTRRSLGSKVKGAMKSLRSKVRAKGLGFEATVAKIPRTNAPAVKFKLGIGVKKPKSKKHVQPGVKFGVKF
jgi:hypothetical protein